VPVQEQAKEIVDAAIRRAVTNAAAAAVASAPPAAKRASPRASAKAKAKFNSIPYNAAVVAAAMVVGLLAILVSRNPASAKMAAASAAAVCFSLLHRVPPRHPATTAHPATRQEA